MISPSRSGAKRAPRTNPAYDVLDEILGPAPTVEPRMMFGLQCFSVAGKPFACAVDGAIALKLPGAQIQAIEDPDVRPFMPDGHRMGGWIAIHRDSLSSFQQDSQLIERALVYASEIAAGVSPDH
ncbi:hypothetical protein BH23CHL5_BH23CHL5_24010 [soil metagenome]